MSTSIEPAPLKEESADAVDSYEKPTKWVVTLGTVRHRHAHTNEIILVPTPSADPNDPLSTGTKTLEFEAQHS
jgi:hypothetical protein